MTHTELAKAICKLASFLDTVIDKYYTDCESAAAELLTWVEEEAMRSGNGRLGFYAVVGISYVCWNVWDKDIRGEQDHVKLISNILEIIRRNNPEFTNMSDLELFKLHFSQFGE